MSQRHADLCPRVIAEAGASDIVSLGKVVNVITFGVHWRVAGLGAPWRRRCLRMAGIRRRDWCGFRFEGGATERGRLGGGEAADNT